MFAGGAPPPPSPEKVAEEDKIASGMMLSIVVACVGLWLSMFLIPDFRPVFYVFESWPPSVVQLFSK
ncbi:hypothetical protein V1527DRAFT_451106 [Lipomyces starkeyi]